jgi:hypothetical protein
VPLTGAPVVVGAAEDAGVVAGVLDFELELEQAAPTVVTTSNGAAMRSNVVDRNMSRVSLPWSIDRGNLGAGAVTEIDGG